MENVFPIRFVDLIDILLVTALVTVAIVWIRKTRAGRIALGLISLGALYIVARLVGLSLLSGLFQGSFAIFVLIAVVIFQKELRRFFEGFAVWGLGRRSRSVQYDPTDLLAEILFTFARRRIGALIVLPGKESIEGNVDGGIELDGKLSRPLLHSIFDPNSVGHDGAVVLVGDRVAKFGVHLPLSTNFDLLEDLGTRHSAALGLSEQTDALCLVVSQERGLITIAKDGRLHSIAAVADLKKLIQDHLAHGAVDKRRPFNYLHLLGRYWIEAVVSAGLVAGIWWVLVAGSVQIEKTYNLPVQVVALPTDLVLVATEPDHVDVVFRGPRRTFQLSRSATFQITIDASLTRLGRRTFTLRPQDVQHPNGLELLEIQPTKIRLMVQNE